MWSSQDRDAQHGLCCEVREAAGSLLDPFSVAAAAGSPIASQSLAA